ncbi:MAG TPA: DoxX family protein [Rhizomicrobium sp.]|nr:DoxX family protein [Rhizomicrobium sp.]
MSFSEYFSPFVGRLVFGWFFLSQVAYYGGDWDGTVALLGFRGIEPAPFVLAIALLLVSMGAVSLILGFHARYGALLLFAITTAAAVLMHDYWHITDNLTARHADFELFACYAAIAGGLLLLVGQGPGPLAFDSRSGGQKKK